MSRGRWLTRVMASLALHAGVVLVFAVGPKETSPSIVVLDLTEGGRVSQGRLEPARPPRVSSSDRGVASERIRLRPPGSAEASPAAPTPVSSGRPASPALEGSWLTSAPTTAASPRAQDVAQHESPTPPAVASPRAQDGTQHESRTPPDPASGSPAVAAAGTGQGYGSQPAPRERAPLPFSVTVSDADDTRDAGGGAVGRDPAADSPGSGIEPRVTTAIARGAGDHGVAPGSQDGKAPQRGGAAAPAREAGGGANGGDRPEGLALAVPGARPEGPPSDFGPYLALLRQRIRESLWYPPGARRRGLAGTVQMEIVIEPSGAIGQVSVVSSSAHPILDAAALDTIRGLSPLPFPPELPPRTLRVRVPVVFELR